MIYHCIIFAVFKHLSVEAIVHYTPRKSTFASLCNMERVALDPLEEEDTTKLYEIVKEHYYYTKSAVAKELLENWSRMSKQFLKVCILSWLIHNNILRKSGHCVPNF